MGDSIFATCLYDGRMETAGERVRERMEAVGRTGADLSAAAGLSPSQLSKSLSGERRFSAVEFARISNALETSLYWLVTGEPDPMEVRVAARHSFDGYDRTYHPEGIDADRQTLQDIALLYQQAYQ